jgi:acetyl-CoA carboxylase biotin carboxyl carrier protein
MDKDKLKELLEFFDLSGLEELEVRHSFWGGTRIRFCRRRSHAGTVPLAAPLPERHAPAAPEVRLADDLHTVNAPMVGTFFRASSPEAAPFVQVGEMVEPGQTLCVIEAMKIMNEIEAPVGGEIIEILTDNAEPVEYSQPLVRIRPAVPR